MKYNLFFILLFGFAGITLTSCEDFLDETPNKSGSAYIYHMDQLLGLTGSPDLYLFQNPNYIRYNIPGNYMIEQFLLSDAIECTPEYWLLGQGTTAKEYSTYCYGTDNLTDQYTMGNTWTPSWERIYRFNTVLENLDKVIQTTEVIRNQVEGEARFGRAYYHFLLMTQYCLWKEDAPGIGYRDNTLPNSIPPRQTVEYTLSRIYEDLRLAEDALRKAGRTTFNLKENFRPTVPTIQAFRARVALYRGDYETALKNASDALAAHNTLMTFKDDEQYRLTPSYSVYLLDQQGEVADTVKTTSMMTLSSRYAEAFAEYPELYLPGASAVSSAPLSESFYNLFDRSNDARWIHFYDGANSMPFQAMVPGIVNGTSYPYCLAWETQQWLKPWHYQSYLRFCSMTTTRSIELLGMTTAEMYLTKAECLARGGDSGAAAEVLKTLRRTRFMNNAAAENIGGSVQEVLDERTREMGAFWRFYDMKRLNGAEHANLSIRREILTDPTDLSTRTILEICPDDPRWALPFYPVEAESMGWEQNPGWE